MSKQEMKPNPQNGKMPAPKSMKEAVGRALNIPNKEGKPMHQGGKFKAAKKPDSKLVENEEAEQKDQLGEEIAEKSVKQGKTEA